MISKIIKQADVQQFLQNFYGVDSDDLFYLDRNNNHTVKNFTITTWEALDPFLNNESCNFFVLIDDEKHDIISIIKFATTLVGSASAVENLGGCMYYLEISDSYKGKGFLKTVTNKFAKIYPGHVFVSNSETEDGHLSHVNDHLKASFEKENVYFYNDSSEFIREFTHYSKKYN